MENETRKCDYCTSHLNVTKESDGAFLCIFHRNLDRDVVLLRKFQRIETPRNDENFADKPRFYRVKLMPWTDVNYVTDQLQS